MNTQDTKHIKGVQEISNAVAENLSGGYFRWEALDRGGRVLADSRGQRLEGALSIEVPRRTRTLRIVGDGRPRQQFNVRALNGPRDGAEINMRPQGDRNRAEVDILDVGFRRAGLRAGRTRFGITESYRPARRRRSPRIISWAGDCSRCSGGGPSDRRIKTDIETVGVEPSLGVNLYSWRYRNNDSTRYVGVMAQDLLATSELSHVVFVAEDGEFAGYYAVDYDALGLRMTTEAEWNEKGMAAVAQLVPVLV